MKKTVELKYGEKTLNLRLTTRALIALEEDVEMSVEKFLTKLEEEGRIGDFVTFFYYCLIHEHKELTAEEAMDLMDEVIEEIPMGTVAFQLAMTYALAISGKQEEKQEAKEVVGVAAPKKKVSAPRKSPKAE